MTLETDAPPTEPNVEDLIKGAQEEKAQEEKQKTINFAGFSVAGWLKRDIPPRDYLLGDVICTTSRWLLYGETGVGKTLFGLEMAAAIAAGEGLLNWKARRPARVLYLDGEMPEETFRERMELIADKYGHGIPLVALNRDALEREYPKGAHMPALNTEPGQEWLLEIIKQVEPELIVFDSIMCLNSGDMLKEESWEPCKPLVRYLTGKKIAQIWLHHTGHNSMQSYGTKTREWEMDTVLSLTKQPEDETGILSEFKKARLRTPRNAAQFESRIIRREPEGWTTDGLPVVKAGKRSMENQRLQVALMSAYERLADAVEKVPGLDGKPVKKVSRDAIRDELANKGLLEKDERGHVKSTERSRFSRVKAALITEHVIVEDNDMVWKSQSF